MPTVDAFPSNLCMHSEILDFKIHIRVSQINIPPFPPKIYFDQMILKQDKIWIMILIIIIITTTTTTTTRTIIIIIIIIIIIMVIIRSQGNIILSRVARNTPKTLDTKGSNYLPGRRTCPSPPPLPDPSMFQQIY